MHIREKLIESVVHTLFREKFPNNDFKSLYTDGEIEIHPGAYSISFKGQWLATILLYDDGFSIKVKVEDKK